MKTSYPTPMVKLFANIIKTFTLSVIALTICSNDTTAQSQELIFNQHTRVSGNEGADGTIYNFSNVYPDIDARVTINGRSSALVQILHLDTTSIGHEKALQPQITYNGNTTPAGVSDWWLEMQISFVKHGTSTAVAVTSFDATALDIDGNNDKINENVSFYGLDHYQLEKFSELGVSNIFETVAGKNKKTGLMFTGPVTNYVNIDTSATGVMVTNTYLNTNSFRIRFGGHSTGVSGAADRLYSLYFKSFTYVTPVQITLPLTLVDWMAALTDENVKLSWATTMQLNTSHFVIERSTNGNDYKEVAMIFADGTSTIKTAYSYTDKMPAFASGILYYRLRCVDLDGRFTYSPVKVVKLGNKNEAMKISTFPNPAQGSVQIVLPSAWQGKKVVFDLYSANGTAVKRITSEKSSQTQNITLYEVPAGIYVVKATCDNNTAVEQIIHTK